MAVDGVILFIAIAGDGITGDGMLVGTIGVGIRDGITGDGTGVIKTMDSGTPIFIVLGNHLTVMLPTTIAHTEDAMEHTPTAIEIMEEET
jgi:hypothetical protein